MSAPATFRSQFAVTQGTGARKLARATGSSTAEPLAIVRCAVVYDQLSIQHRGVADNAHIVAVDRYGQGCNYPR